MKWGMFHPPIRWSTPSSFNFYLNDLLPFLTELDAEQEEKKEHA